MSNPYILLVAFSVFIASCSQLFLKKGSNMEHSTLIKEYMNAWVITGYILLGLSLVTNIFALSKGVFVKELSVIESLSYLFIPSLSFVFLKEKISRKFLFSVILIIIGIITFFS